MSRETSLRRYVVEALNSLNATPVENSIYPGFPDVEFIGGTIELKSIEKWPARPSTAVRVKHFTADQRTWLELRWRAGGLTLLLLRVGTEHLFFDGLWASTCLGHVPRSELEHHALRHWGPRQITRDALLEFVVRQRAITRLAKSSAEEDSC